MSEIAKLVPKVVERQKGVMTTLENFVAIAQAEGLTGIAIAGVDAQGFTHTAFESGENIATLIGAVVRIQKRLLDHQDG